MIPNNKLFKFMKDNLHLKKYKIEELPTDLVEEIRRTFQIFDVDNGKIFLFGLPYLGVHLNIGGSHIRLYILVLIEPHKSVTFGFE